jgi:hypothetical protein
MGNVLALTYPALKSVFFPVQLQPQRDGYNLYSRILSITGERLPTSHMRATKTANKKNPTATVS